MASKTKNSKEPSRTVLATSKVQNKHAPPPPPETCDVRRFKKEHPFLSELLRDDGVIFECDAQAPAPSKDYGRLEITDKQVILRWWKITLRNIDGSMYPGEIKDSYEDFYNDETAQREISRIFGQSILDYCLNLVQGKFDWFERLPPKVLIRILSNVNLDDIPQLSLVSKTIRQLCRDNDLWKIYYARHYGRHTVENRDLVHLAERRGWRHVFFTNRLKLQMQLRREAQLDRHHPEDPTDYLKSRERRGHLQPSPPTTPRQQDRFTQPSIRRHSFATRQEPPLVSPRLSALDDEEDSPRSGRPFIGDRVRSPRVQPPPSPSSSVRSLAGSVATAASAQPPFHPSNRSSNRH